MTKWIISNTISPITCVLRYFLSWTLPFSLRGFKIIFRRKWIQHLTLKSCITFKGNRKSKREVIQYLLLVLSGFALVFIDVFLVIQVELLIVFVRLFVLHIRLAFSVLSLQIANVDDFTLDKLNKSIKWDGKLRKMPQKVILNQTFNFSNLG